MDAPSIKQLYLLSLGNMNQAKALWHKQTLSINAYVLEQMQRRAKQGYFNCVIDLTEAGQAANNTPFEAASPSQIQDTWVILASIVQKSPYLPFKDGKRGVKLSVQRLSWQYALVSWLAR